MSDFIVLTEREAAARLTLSARTLSRARLRGEIPFLQLSDRRVGYDLAALRAWAAGRQHGGGAGGAAAGMTAAAPSGRARRR